MLLRLVSAALVATFAVGPQHAVVPDGRVVLFNGKTLDGWYVWLRGSGYADPKQVFTVVNGQIRISGEEWGGIATRQSYRDYHLTVEWRWGTETWGDRKGKARDSGILIHGVGEDGAAGGCWLESIESQIIEGGTGDVILVAGKNRPSLSANVRQQGRELYWDKNGTPMTVTNGRIDWWGRSPEWSDVLGFRGRDGVEKRPGEWNRQEVYADADKLVYVLNGTVVNKASELSHRSGKIQIQSEGAEIFIRKVELEPIRAPGGTAENDSSGPPTAF